MSTYKKIQVVERCTDLTKALKVVEEPIPTDIPSGHVLLKVQTAGVNATDLNAILKGSYGGTALPHGLGLEGLCTVVKVGDGVDHPLCKEGALCLSFGAMGHYAEYHVVHVAGCVFHPQLTSDPLYLCLPISALTAAVSIGELAGPHLLQITATNRQPVALVTAAAGGTGQFAVQYLKRKFGCKVIGTCGGASKATFLESIGVDVAFDYKKEGSSLAECLKKEAPNGVDVIYESVGGDMFETALANIAVRGQLIVIGSITGYASETAFSRAAGAAPIQGQLLMKSASMHGFFLSHWKDSIPTYLLELMHLIGEKRIECHVDASKSFEGVESVPAAIQHLHSGASFGKVVVHMSK